MLLGTNLTQINKSDVVCDAGESGKSPEKVPHFHMDVDDHLTDMAPKLLSCCGPRQTVCRYNQIFTVSYCKDFKI